jgi:hypothetical protein
MYRNKPGRRGAFVSADSGVRRGVPSPALIPGIFKLDQGDTSKSAAWHDIGID